MKCESNLANESHFLAISLDFPLSFLSSIHRELNVEMKYFRHTDCERIRKMNKNEENRRRRQRRETAHCH